MKKAPTAAAVLVRINIGPFEATELLMQSCTDKYGNKGRVVYDPVQDKFCLLCSRVQKNTDFWDIASVSQKEITEVLKATREIKRINGDSIGISVSLWKTERGLY